MGEVIDKREFYAELEHLINRHSQENNSNTPDFILAKFLGCCLEAFDAALNERTNGMGEVAPVNTMLIPLMKSCKHRNAWVINGGHGLWCYECGAYRQAKVSGTVIYPLGKRWIKPTGIGGKNPSDKLVRR